jgi:TonB family protein
MPLRNDDQRFLELLDKWISGDFTRTDLLEIRQLAASDPFRAEAWEGFNALPEANHQQQLETLRRRLNKQPEKQVGARRWWFYAAAAAALLVLGIALPRLWQDKGFIEQQQAPLAAATEKLALPDSASAMPASTTEATAAPSTEKYSATSPQPQQATPAAIQQPDAIVSSAAAPGAPMSDQAPTPVEAIAAGGEQADEVLAEAPAPRTEASEEKVAAAPPPAPVTRNTEPLPAAKPATSNLGKAKAKRQSPAAQSKDWAETDTKSNMDSLRREARKADKPAESEPVNGWDAFNQFARGAARLTPQARAQNVSGSVRVQFSVSPEGEAQNFIFLRRLGYGLDDQAKTIIQNWAWIPGVKNSVIVEISFVR